MLHRLCDHRSYCKSDTKSIYIGQDHHIAYPPHRTNSGYFPAGWPEVRDNKLDGGDIFVLYQAHEIKFYIIGTLILWFSVKGEN